MIPILSGNVASALPSGYDVANSCRFNSADSAKMAITFSGAGTSLRKATFSFWIKRSNLTVDEELLYRISSGSDYFNIAFSDTDTLKIKQSISSSVNLEFISNAVYRDPSAWMHLLVVFDTTQSTESSRVKIYVNGTQVTSWSTSTYPGQNTDMLFGAANANTIASSGGGNYFGGYLCEVCYCDGQSLTPSDFGEFDSDSPTIWKPKDPSGLTFGTNGFYLDFEDSSNLGDDESGNGNDLTETNIVAADQATDTCTNNFCTMNPLDFTPTTFSQGNLKLNFAQSPNVFGITTGTLFMGSGKYYFEAKITSPDSSTGIQVGVIQVEPYLSRLTAPGVDLSLFFGLGARFITTGGVHKVLNGTDSSISDSWSNDDIIRIAYDGSAGKIYMFNGTSELTGQDISAGTSFNNGTLTPGTMVLPYTSFGDGGSGTKTAQVEWNFGGCPAFSISSGNTDANGYGNFEYSVPSGYYALNSKNLAEFG